MFVTVPYKLFSQPGMGGLGQDLANDVIDDESSSTADSAGTDSSGNLLYPTLMTGPTPSSTDLSNAGSSNTSANSTTAQDIAALGPALAAAAKGISAASGPYQIPGSNYIYNPATGQILANGIAVGTYNSATGAITAIGSLNVPMMIGLGVAAILLVVLLGGKR